MGAVIDWLISTPLGLAAIVGGLVILFTLMAFMSERKTRRLYPDRNRRGTKAVAKAKAKAAEEKATKATKTASPKATKKASPKDDSQDD
jgi:predicted lipid-binding transport protein (Tim44 family)